MALTANRGDRRENPMCLKCGKLINCDYKSEDVMNTTPYEATLLALEFAVQARRLEPQATERLLEEMDVSNDYLDAVILRLDLMTARKKLRWE
jgi:hypothetical protein